MSSKGPKKKKKKVVYFLLVKLREKYLQLTGGAVMIQVQSVCILFPVAKYWLSSMAADGQNGERRLCWKEWASVRVTSGPSWARWTWSLHQAASLELAGAFGAFCHSSHCSCAQHPIPHLPQCQEWGSVYCVVSAGFAHATALSAFSRAHLYVPCARETYEVAAVKNSIVIRKRRWWWKRICLFNYLIDSVSKNSSTNWLERL